MLVSMPKTKKQIEREVMILLIILLVFFLGVCILTFIASNMRVNNTGKSYDSYIVPGPSPGNAEIQNNIIKDNKRTNFPDSIFLSFITLLGIILFLVFFRIYKKERINPEFRKNYTETEANRNLKEFIEIMLSKGHSKKRIKSTLVNAGWKKSVIDNALKNDTR
jgi:hypothetical protein